MFDQNYVVGLLESEQLEEDMQHQLYLLQHNLLSLLQLRLHTPIQPQDGAALQKIKAVFISFMASENCY